MVATCGGECVCLIDCQTGKVLKRFKHVGEVSRLLQSLRSDKGRFFGSDEMTLLVDVIIIEKYFYETRFCLLILISRVAGQDALDPSFT